MDRHQCGIHEALVGQRWPLVIHPNGFYFILLTSSYTIQQQLEVIPYIKLRVSNNCSSSAGNDLPSLIVLPVLP